MTVFIVICALVILAAFEGIFICFDKIPFRKKGKK